jgi:transposase
MGGRAPVKQEYMCLNREGKGVVRRSLAKMTGLSRAPVTRLIGKYLESGQVHCRKYRRQRFPQRYMDQDIELLAEVDEAQEGPSGPATQKLLQRALYDFGDQRFQRLATLSVGHLYGLRASKVYRKQRFVYQPTRPSAVSIGERKRPDPRQRPGFLRVDTAHQGDEVEHGKGVYHINAVDQVMQWEVVGGPGRSARVGWSRYGKGSPPSTQPRWRSFIRDTSTSETDLQGWINATSMHARPSRYSRACCWICGQSGSTLGRRNS